MYVGLDQVVGREAPGYLHPRKRSHSHRRPSRLLRSKLHHNGSWKHEITIAFIYSALDFSYILNSWEKLFLTDSTSASKVLTRIYLGMRTYGSISLPGIAMPLPLPSLHSSFL